MSAVYNALVRLSDSIQTLEATAETQEDKIRKALAKRPRNTAQADLFAQPAPANLNQVDSAALAYKLDLAIQRVEQVLREA